MLAVRFVTVTATATADFDGGVERLVAAMKKRRPFCDKCLEIDIIYSVSAPQPAKRLAASTQRARLVSVGPEEPAGRRRNQGRTYDSVGADS
jgi:hypothetical protein